jgi:hypothetical protein
MSKTKLMENEWLKFKGTIGNADELPEEQLAQIRQIFLSGAVYLHRLVAKSGDSGNDKTAIKNLDAIFKELDEFVKETQKIK